MDLNAHYGQLLGIGEEWKVSDVRMDMPEKRVDIFLDYAEKSAPCPLCGTHSPMHDEQGERVWRHLDTMQFMTFIHARPPRCRCPDHGARVIDIPWAEKNSRFTLMFEALAIDVLKCARSNTGAMALLRLNWHQVQRIKANAVRRGLERRKAEDIAFVGMDEKSFLSGRRSQSFACVMTDLDNHRVLEVSRGRSEEGAAELIDKALDPVQRYMVCGVAMDMSAPFAKAVREKLVCADVVYDKFHLMKHLNDAVNDTRRMEHARLLKKHDKRLSKTRYLWLKGMEHMSPEARKRLKDLLSENLLTGKAWGLKEAFKEFWLRRDASFARSFFARWHEEVMASKIRPLVRVAKMFRRHLDGILKWYGCFIDNAMTEGFNSAIQAIKACARGFRNFENYRTAILFSCGRLAMHPSV